MGIAARRAFEKISDGTATLVFPAIAFAELGFAIRKLKLAVDLDTLVGVLQETERIEIVDMLVSMVMMLPGLRAIPEMHDRLITAEAISRDATLITKDHVIVGSGLVRTVWD